MPRQINGTEPCKIRRNGTIISRFTTEDGRIGFTIATEPGGDDASSRQEIDVDLMDIYDHVTPAELERYEHHDWELESQREQNRRKVGRPRKRVPSFDGFVGVDKAATKPKRPLGRPKKSSVLSGRSAFAGVYIPSPVKTTERPPTSLSSRKTSLTSQSGSAQTLETSRQEFTSASSGTAERQNIDSKAAALDATGFPSLITSQPQASTLTN